MIKLYSRPRSYIPFMCHSVDKKALSEGKKGEGQSSDSWSWLAGQEGTSAAVWHGLPLSCMTGREITEC